jgi:hypothetical protein
MARTPEQLFAACAARVAEILREHHRLDPGALLRITPADFTIEGRVGEAPGATPAWHHVHIRPEQLEWSGPDATAEAFVRDFLAARRSAGPGARAPGPPHHQE